MFYRFANEQRNKLSQGDAAASLNRLDIYFLTIYYLPFVFRIVRKGFTGQEGVICVLIFNHERSFRGRREGYLLFYDLLFTIYFALSKGFTGQEGVLCMLILTSGRVWEREGRKQKWEAENQSPIQ